MLRWRRFPWPSFAKVLSILHELKTKCLKDIFLYVIWEKFVRYFETFEKTIYGYAHDGLAKCSLLKRQQGPRRGDLNGWWEQWLKAHYRITGGKSTARWWCYENFGEQNGKLSLRKERWLNRELLPKGARGWRLNLEIWTAGKRGGWTWRYEREGRTVAEPADLNKRKERRLKKSVWIWGMRNG